LNFGNKRMKGKTETDFFGKIEVGQVRGKGLETFYL
jgi:hypothetical protein